MSITNNLSLILNQLDPSGISTLNRSIGAIAYEGSVGQFQIGILDDTSEHQQSLPSTITVIRQLYLKNTHATGTLTVAWTPNGGAKTTILVLRPGAVLSFWEPDSTSGGISTLYYTASVANVTFEHFIGG